MSLPPDGTSLSPECPAMLPGIAVDSQGSLAEDIPCRRCGYNLRGLAPAGTCPECGTPVGRSLIGDLLRYCDPRWVTQVSEGMSVLMLAVMAALVGGCVLGIALGAANAFSGPVFTGQGLAHQGLRILVAVLALLGAWRCTLPEPGRPTTERDPRSRRLAGAFLVAALGLLVFEAVISQGLPVSARSVLGSVQSGVAACGYVALLAYAQTLAMRIPDEQLTRQTRTVMWGLGIASGVVIVVQTAVSVFLASQVMTVPTIPPAAVSPATVSRNNSPGNDPTAMNDEGEDAPPPLGVTPITPVSPITSWGLANPQLRVLLSLAIGVPNLILIFIWIRALGLLGRYGVALKAAAEQARTTWAAATPTAGPPTAVS